jgi:dTDP-4-dehydrorhamnose 3,5-epimerase
VKFIETSLPGVIIVEPNVFKDQRGFFLETYRADLFEQHGVPARFIQDNHSKSVRGTLRGLHFQCPHGQGKLVRVTQGEVFDVAVDVRAGSPTFGKWFGTTLSAENMRQMYIPTGFAHGFCVLSDTAEFQYKCTDFYAPDCELGVRWDDPAIAIEWPVRTPLLSAKDQAYPCLSEIPANRLPPYRRP